MLSAEQPHPGQNFQQQLRFRLIEIIVLWEGKVVTTHLCQSFKIQRNQAQKDLKAYRALAPGNLSYDAKRKAFLPAPDFRPVFTRGVVEEYLHALSDHPDIVHTFKAMGLPREAPEILQPLLRRVDPGMFRLIMQAIEQRQRIDIHYASMSEDDLQERIITPHSLVCTPLRWHVRAYCEKHGEFRDFVLSRFRAVYNLEGPARFGKTDDQRWQQYVDLILQPHPALTPRQQDIIAQDYAMTNGQLVLPVRSALLPYVLQSLNLDITRQDQDAEIQQLVVANLHTVCPHAF